jgi:hypothetical protein
LVKWKKKTTDKKTFLLTTTSSDFQEYYKVHKLVNAESRAFLDMTSYSYKEQYQASEEAAVSLRSKRITGHKTVTL